MGKVKKLTLTGIFAAFAVALSTIEYLIPVSAFIPIPGLRLGLSNLAVMTAFYLVGKTSGASVGLIKALLTFLTFGNITSFAISFSGTAFAFFSLLISEAFFRKPFSFIGISALSAVFHSLGQIIAAALIMGSSAIFAVFLPLGISSVFTGILCGFLMNCVYSAIFDKVIAL